MLKYVKSVKSPEGPQPRLCSGVGTGLGMGMGRGLQGGGGSQPLGTPRGGSAEPLGTEDEAQRAPGLALLAQGEWEQGMDSLIP